MRGVLVAGVAVSLLAVSPAAEPQVIELVSVNLSGTAGDGESRLETSHHAISADGRFVVFESDAGDLVAGDANGTTDVFRRDLVLGVTARVTVAADGGDALGVSENPSMSADGRYVAFASDAGNLVSGDGNGLIDVFVRDLNLGQTIRVSEADGGGDPDGDSNRPSISPDGRYLTFSSNATNLIPGVDNGAGQIYFRNLDSGLTELVSVGHDGNPGDANSWMPEISRDGGRIGFVSGATNLVPGDDGGQPDVFVRDLDAGTTVRASVNMDGDDPDNRSGPPSLSDDGSIVTFWSRATDLVPGDTNGMDDIFLRNLPMGVTERVSLSDAGAQATGGGSWYPVLTPGARYAVFMSDAADLVPDDGNGWGDVFARDRMHGTTENLCFNIAGLLADGYSRHPSVTPDGLYVVFESTAANFADGDANGMMDIYLAHGPAALLVDGFEAGDASRWSAVVP